MHVRRTSGLHLVTRRRSDTIGSDGRHLSGRGPRQTTSVMTQERRLAVAQSVEQSGLGVGVDGPDRVDHDRRRGTAGKQPFHGRPDAIVGGDAIDDERRPALVVAGDQSSASGRLKTSNSLLLEREMAAAARRRAGRRPRGPPSRDTAVAGIAAGRRCRPCSAAGTATARDRRAMAAGGRQDGIPWPAANPAQPLQVRRGSIAIPARRAPRRLPGNRAGCRYPRRRADLRASRVASVVRHGRLAADVRLKRATSLLA